MREGGVATSSTRTRAWGDGLHHVIDPTTGSSAATDLVQVTVTAPTCAQAEILSKADLLRGSRAAGGAAVSVTSEGRVLVTAPIEGAA